MKKRIVGVDFETYSTVDLLKRGLDNYVNCPQFDCIVSATVELNGQKKVTDTPSTVRAHLEPLILDPYVYFVAHNAMFEYCVLVKLAERWGIKPPSLYRFLDTAAQGSAMGLPAGLEPISQVCFGEGKQADGMELIRLFSIPNRQGQKTNPQLYPEKWQRYKDYCLKDAELSLRVFMELPRLDPIDQAYWFSVARMNLRGFMLDLPTIDKVLHDVDMIKADANATTAALTKNIATKATQGKRILGWLAEQGYASKTINSAQCDAWLADPELPDDIRKIIQARLKASKSTFGKYSAFARYASADGRNRHAVFYHGTHTGRLAGKGSQPQNVAYDKTKTITVPDEHKPGKMRPARPDEVLDLYLKGELPDEWDKSNALVAMTRAVIMATPGKKFYIVDYMAIEARIQVWLAGDTKRIEMYTRDEDLYKPMAGIIFKKAVSEVTKDERDQYGKPTVLGCGYGMGPAKFAAQYGKSEEEAKRCVYAYRDAYPLVKTLWDKLERAFKQCLSYKRATQTNKVRFDYKVICGLPFVVATPPGGHKIYYLDPKIDKDGGLTFRRKTSKSDFRANLWGGTLLENICQNIAGYIMKVGTMNAELLGGLPILQIHDELVAEVHPTIDVEALDAAMINIPGLDGLPLGVESKLAERYGK